MNIVITTNKEGKSINSYVRDIVSIKKIHGFHLENSIEICRTDNFGCSKVTAEYLNFKFGGGNDPIKKITDIYKAISLEDKKYESDIIDPNDIDSNIKYNDSNNSEKEEQ